MMPYAYHCHTTVDDVQRARAAARSLRQALPDSAPQIRRTPAGAWRVEWWEPSDDADESGGTREERDDG